MNKKCGNCGWLTDKCKNPDNPNYNKFREKEDRCTVLKHIFHLFDFEHDSKVPDYDENKQSGYRATKCGYQRKYVTTDKSKVTCKQCLNIIKKED